jgi:tetrahydromethanopterin S-methyltransferase subunit B
MKTEPFLTGSATRHYVPKRRGALKSFTLGFIIGMLFLALVLALKGNTWVWNPLWW